MAASAGEAAWAKKDLKGAMLWFYLDTEGKRQGPFYPGQMRQWYDAGYFPKTQKIAPSFKGEVPKEYAELGVLFLKKEDAFLARSDIALWPHPQPAAAAEEDEDEEENEVMARPVGRPRWLEDSIERQKAGIKRKMIYGPSERENYN